MPLKRIGKLILCLLTVCLLTVFLMTGCFGETPVDNRENTLKPDISASKEDYDKLTAKRSVTDTTFKVTLFKAQATSSALTPISLSENFVADRIFNEDKIYIDAAVRTSYADDALVNLYKFLIKNKGSLTNISDSDILAFLEGNLSLALRSGIADGVYNLKVFASETGKEERSLFYGATDDKNVNALLSSFGIPFDGSISDYLVSGGLVNLNNVADWLSQDVAGKYFSTADNKFIYSLVGDPQKVKDMIFSVLPEEEEVASVISDYAKLLSTVKNKVSVSDETVDALVHPNKMPDKSTTSLRIDLNINITELNDVLGKIHSVSDEDRKTTVDLLRSVAALYNLRGTEGQLNTVGISLEIVTVENFLYNEDCSLEGKEIYFASLDEEIPDRKVYVYSPDENTPDEENGSDGSAEDILDGILGDLTDKIPFVA